MKANTVEVVGDKQGDIKSVKWCVRETKREPRVVNRAVIRLSEELLMEWLQFYGGKLIAVETQDWPFNAIDLTIEHPDLPLVPITEIPPLVVPLYESQYDPEDGHLISIKRTMPEE